MEAALLQPQWNMKAMMADNDEADSDEAVSDDEGIEGFNVSSLFFIFIHYLVALLFPGVLCYCAPALYVSLFVSIMNYFYCVIVGNYQQPADGPTGATLPIAYFSCVLCSILAFYYSIQPIEARRYSFHQNHNTL